MSDPARPALLFVDVKWPRPDRDAASQRAVQLIRALTDLGFDVDVGVVDRIDDDGFGPSALPAGASSIPTIGAAAILEHLARRHEPYRVAVLAWTRVAQALLDAIRAASPSTTVVFDTVDVNHVREYRHARVTGNANLLRRSLAMKAAELHAVEAADRTLAVTIEDARTLEAACPDRRVDVVTLAVDERRDPVPGPAGRSGLLFLGNMHAWHNVDAVLHLVQEVLPPARALRPGLTLTVAGAGYAKPIEEIADPAVLKLGTVTDLAPVFDRARAFACPLRIGSGIKGKLLVALALGLPVVTTPIGAEGMGLTDGRDALIAESTGEFVAAIARLDADDDLWRRLSGAGQALARSAYSDLVVARQVRSIFAPLLDIPAPLAAGARSRGGG